MMKKEDFLKSGLLESYVLGIASPEQIEQVEKMLGKYPELKAIRNELQNGLEKFCTEKYKTQLPPELDKKLSSFIDKIDQPVNEPAQEIDLLQRWKWYARIAAGFALIFASMLFVNQTKKTSLQRQLLASNADKERIIGEYRDLVAVDEELRNHLAFINHNLTNQIEAKGTELAPKSCAKIHWNPATNSLLISNVEMLPEAPEGKEYHFWVDVEGEMLHVGGLKESLEKILEEEIFSKPTSINLTLEDGPPQEPNVNALVMVGNLGES